MTTIDLISISDDDDDDSTSSSNIKIQKLNLYLKTNQEIEKNVKNEIKTDELIKHIEFCLIKTEQNQSKLDSILLELPGMSNIKNRHFYNNICSYDNIEYLEIGLWKGSSFCAAIYKNNIRCVGIDNWSEFDGREEFMVNLDKFKGNNDIEIKDNDCWQVDIDEIGKFNVFLYDGNHSNESQMKALTYYYDCLYDNFIYIIDDWNARNIREATFKSIANNNLNILYKKEIYTDSPNGDGTLYDWWNGCGIFVLEKNKIK